MLPEALRFQVGLIDQISKPLGDIQRQFSDVSKTYRQGTHTMAAGAAGMVGAGFTLQQALMPAIEMDRALGEVKSLGVADDALKEITKTAFQFSAEFGQSAVEVVRHAEGIKNAMGNMPADVMASVTRSSAVLATAMKSDATTVNRYLKNLYGNYQAQADAMGKDNWTQQVAGMTATAKQLFGVEMDAIEGMVDGMHSLTSTMGVSLQEQLAVFGMLKGQMSEGDAVTQYTNFLENAVAAQEDLGVKLTDTHGQLLPMQQVLKNIAPLLEGLSGTEARTLLDNAGLGDGALMLTSLVNRADEFAGSMNALNKVTGMDAATKMAADMTDQWQRMEHGLFAIRAAIGTALLPSLIPLISSLADGGQEIVKWTQLFPNITKYIGYAAVAVLGLVAAGGLISILTGAASVAWATFGLGVSILKTVTVVMWALSTGVMGVTWAILKFTVALLANPIFLIAAGVTAAITAIGALIYYWNDLKASFGDTAWFQVLTVLSAQFRMMFEVMKGGWQWVMSGFSDTSGFDGLFTIVDEVRAVFANLFGWISESFGSVLETVKGVADWIPGFGGDDESLEVKSKSVAHATPYAQIQQGGAAKSIASYQNSSTNYGGVNIYPAYMSSPQDMASELEMAAG
ncbi:phage tail tape measure protein [Aliivibrio fischeri]|uniref:phage tail tape measure protein n=1 Tax=Aliivibrio fischeri TaxID=668 RepID=UPI0012D9C5E9|nr:phage tail tape measure protein [Aliivibrio fischeri]MUK91573.1 phage tail tape measure protein [Aliivibrio fischeri]